MMGTTADKLEYLQGTKAAIKQAIVNKGVAVPDGTTFRAYAEKIGSIIKVPALSNPGSADDLRSGMQLVGANGSIVTGNLPEVIQATPSISVSSGGLITASATQSGGIVEGGSKSAMQQLTTQGAKTVTPTTSEQTVVASGRYTTGDVKVAGDANLVPENIAEGVSIFGVTGTHSGGGGGYQQVPISQYFNRDISSNGFICINGPGNFRPLILPRETSFPNGSYSIGISYVNSVVCEGNYDDQDIVVDIESITIQNTAIINGYGVADILGKGIFGVPAEDIILAAYLEVTP